jgi:transcriptional regulator with XRE-family HTH domain
MERGLSQEQLADLAGLHRNYIGNIERGENGIGIDNIVLLARSSNLNQQLYSTSGKRRLKTSGLTGKPLRLDEQLMRPEKRSCYEKRNKETAASHEHHREGKKT